VDLVVGELRHGQAALDRVGLGHRGASG
jgi:hypothetical protein